MGTMILTASGLTAIENIRAGDKVISTNADTFETAEKTVMEIEISGKGSGKNEIIEYRKE